MEKLLCMILAALCILLAACGNTKADKGDTGIKEFGGIIDWKCEVIK